MYINKKTGASYGFVAPEIQEDERKDTRVPFPTFGIVNPDLESEGTPEISVERTYTVVDFGDEPLDNPKTIKLNASEGLPQGSRCMVKWKNGGTQKNVIAEFGDDDDSVSMSGIANQTACYELIYINKKWYLLK